MANRKPRKENKPKGSYHLSTTGNKILKQSQVSCQQLQTQGFHVNTCYFWPLLNDSGYLAALGLQSCMSATSCSSVVAAADRQGKLGTWSHHSLLLTLSLLYLFCYLLASTVAFEFATFVRVSFVCLFVLIHFNFTSYLIDFNFTLIPFWKPQPLDL